MMGAFIFRYEWLHFWRNRLQVGLFSLLFLFGLYAIYYGNRQISGQREALALAQQQVNTEWAHYERAFRMDTCTKEAKQAYQLATDPAYAWYRHPYLAQLAPSALAPLAVGQRDLTTSFYRLTGMSLYYGLFQTELANPQKLLAGNFDLSFVLVYLFPLLIIALSFSLLSGDKETGVLPLLQVQGASVRQVLLYKLLFSLSLVTGLAMMLSLLGFIVSGVDWSRDADAMIQWLLTVLGYCTFWFGLVWLMVSFNQPSAVNALVGVGCWLVFLLIIPSLLSAYLSAAWPVDSSELASLSRREGIANEEDERQVRTIIRRYVQTQAGLVAPADTLYQPNRAAKGYVAFTQLNDAEHRPLVESYWHRIAARAALANGFDLINPAVNAQELLSRCAQTDLATQLAFLQSLPGFHQKIVQFYTTRLFKNQLIRQNDYAQRPRYKTLGATADSRSWLSLLYLFGAAVALFGTGWFTLHRQL